jgi:hypothetical protein
MKKLILAALILISSNAWAATAIFTGNAEMIQTVTGRSGWNCEYYYAGHTFWMTFTTYCPHSVEIQ